ncbi:MAG: SDR family oxidoreductase [Roseovarius sp.]|uniref:SDR family oxidoreductase n=1 Tax=Roseovarius sp. TaxID=1486281 RepID=UPI004058184C
MKKEDLHGYVPAIATPFDDKGEIMEDGFVELFEFLIVTGGGSGIGEATAKVFAEAQAITGRVDVLLNNAGGPGPIAPVAEVAALKRWVAPEEAGRAALYYASDLSSAITGDKMKVDCGRF